MGKFRLLREKLVRDGVVSESAFCMPAPLPDETLYKVHTPGYVRAFSTNTLDFQAIRRIGLPWSEELVRRTRIAVAGTLLTARLALRHGLSVNTAGGTHHAFPDYGSGFCILNDMAVAAAQLLHEETVRKVLIIDLDVHQGDGTHFIFRNDPRVFTFSLHCEKNFPVRRQPGDHEIELPEGTGDEAYLERLGDVLPFLIETARPDLVIYDAGVDVHRDDRLGRFALTDRGLRRREEMVIGSVRSAGIPLACVIGGGYDNDIYALVDRHAILHQVASELEN
jgi:acetoin utilization deacetylase AcuC-like enzyme